MEVPDTTTQTDESSIQKNGSQLIVDADSSEKVKVPDRKAVDTATVQEVKMDVLVSSVTDLGTQDASLLPKPVKKLLSVADNEAESIDKGIEPAVEKEDNSLAPSADSATLSQDKDTKIDHTEVLPENRSSGGSEIKGSLLSEEAESANGSELGASDAGSDCEVVDEFLDEGWEVMDDADDSVTSSERRHTSGKEKSSGGKRTVKESRLQTKLKKSKLPIIGAEYVLEQYFYHGAQVKYRCFLCWQTLHSEHSVIDHLLDRNHRLKYLATHLASLEGLFPAVSYRLWPQEWKDALDNLCMKLQEIYGFLNVTHIDTYTPNIKQKIFHSKHYSEEKLSLADLNLPTTVVAPVKPSRGKRSSSKSDSSSRSRSDDQKDKSKRKKSEHTDSKGLEPCTKSHKHDESSNEPKKEPSKAPGEEPEESVPKEGKSTLELSESDRKPGSVAGEHSDEPLPDDGTKKSSSDKLPACDTSKSVDKESSDASDFAEGDDLAGWEVMDEAGDDVDESSHKSHSATHDCTKGKEHYTGGARFKYESKLQIRLKRLKLPVIGTEYVLEQHLHGGTQIMYRCFLCWKDLTEGAVTNHLMARNHRMRYLERHLPSFEAMFPKEDYLRWSSEWKDALDNLCVKLQETLGFMDIPIITKYIPHIADKILESKHYSEGSVSVADFKFPLPTMKPTSTDSASPLKSADTEIGVNQSGSGTEAELPVATDGKVMGDDAGTESSAKKGLSGVSETSEHQSSDMSDNEIDAFSDDWQVMDEAGDDPTEDVSAGPSAMKDKASGSTSDEATIQATLKEANLPFIGTEYILEQVIIGSSQRRYRCYLCWSDLVKEAVPTHLLGTRHRLKYLNMHLPSFTTMFPVEYPRSWPQEWLDVLNDLCSKLFETFGLMKVTYAPHYTPNIAQAIFSAPHYTEDKVSFADVKFPDSPTKKLRMHSTAKGENEGSKTRSTKVAKRPSSLEHSDNKKKAKRDDCSLDGSALVASGKVIDSLKKCKDDNSVTTVKPKCTVKKATGETSDAGQLPLKCNKKSQESLMDTVSDGSFSDTMGDSAENADDSCSSQTGIVCVDGRANDQDVETAKKSQVVAPSHKTDVKGLKSNLGEGKRPGKIAVSGVRLKQKSTAMTRVSQTGVAGAKPTVMANESRKYELRQDSGQSKEKLSATIDRLKTKYSLKVRGKYPLKVGMIFPSKSKSMPGEADSSKHIVSLDKKMKLGETRVSTSEDVSRAAKHTVLGLSEKRRELLSKSSSSHYGDREKRGFYRYETATLKTKDRLSSWRKDDAERFRQKTSPRDMRLSPETRENILRSMRERLPSSKRGGREHHSDREDDGTSSSRFWRERHEELTREIRQEEMALQDARSAARERNSWRSLSRSPERSSTWKDHFPSRHEGFSRPQSGDGRDWRENSAAQHAEESWQRERMQTRDGSRDLDQEQWEAKVNAFIQKDCELLPKLSFHTSQKMDKYDERMSPDFRSGRKESWSERLVESGTQQRLSQVHSEERGLRSKLPDSPEPMKRGTLRRLQERPVSSGSGSHQRFPERFSPLDRETRARLQERFGPLDEETEARLSERLRPIESGSRHRLSEKFVSVESEPRAQMPQRHPGEGGIQVRFPGHVASAKGIIRPTLPERPGPMDSSTRSRFPEKVTSMESAVRSKLSERPGIGGNQSRMPESFLSGVSGPRARLPAFPSHVSPVNWVQFSEQGKQGSADYDIEGAWDHLWDRISKETGMALSRPQNSHPASKGTASQFAFGDNRVQGAQNMQGKESSEFLFPGQIDTMARWPHEKVEHSLGKTQDWCPGPDSGSGMLTGMMPERSSPRFPAKPKMIGKPGEGGQSNIDRSNVPYFNADPLNYPLPRGEGVAMDQRFSMRQKQSGIFGDSQGRNIERWNQDRNTFPQPGPSQAAFPGSEISQYSLSQQGPERFEQIVPGRQNPMSSFTDPQGRAPDRFNFPTMDNTRFPGPGTSRPTFPSVAMMRHPGPRHAPEIADLGGSIMRQSSANKPIETWERDQERVDIPKMIRYPVPRQAGKNLTQHLPNRQDLIQGNKESKVWDRPQDMIAYPIRRTMNDNMDPRLPARQKQFNKVPESQEDNVQNLQSPRMISYPLNRQGNENVDQRSSSYALENIPDSVLLQRLATAVLHTQSLQSEGGQKQFMAQHLASLLTSLGMGDLPEERLVRLLNQLGCLANMQNLAALHPSQTGTRKIVRKGSITYTF